MRMSSYLIYKLAESGRPFELFHRSFASIPGGVVDNHLLCFGTKTFFKKLMKAKQVHMDGTFKVCPSPYKQLFTLCSFHHDDDAGYEDSLNNRLIPRIYCLLSGKSQTVYEELFQLIIDKADQWNVDVEWEHSMSDYEASIFNALSAKFPLINSRGCHFHYCQAIFRRMEK
jgi:MULE transposase domain